MTAGQLVCGPEQGSRLGSSSIWEENIQLSVLGFCEDAFIAAEQQWSFSDAQHFYLLVNVQV